MSALPTPSDPAVLETSRLAERVVDVLSAILPAGGSLHEPEFSGREWAYVKECLDTGWVSSVGAFVERFEAMLSETTGVAHAVATVNG